MGNPYDRVVTKDGRLLPEEKTKIKTFTVEFYDTFEAKTEKEAYKLLLEYLETCIKHQDVTGFQFEEVE